MNESIKVPTCPICGNTMPPDKKICWCCEHEPKLGIKKDNQCKDSCEIDFTKKE